MEELPGQARRPHKLSSRLRNTTLPDVSGPCAWKTCFARSKPIVLASDTDASCSVVTTTTLAHQGRRGGVHPITVCLNYANRA
jgi:hypothetical protein